jgi:hypothetical protein
MALNLSDPTGDKNLMKPEGPLVLTDQEGRERPNPPAGQDLYVLALDHGRPEIGASPEQYLPFLVCYFHVTG